MNLPGILLTVIFVITMASSFYYWQKGQKVLFRYITWREAMFHPFQIRSKVPDDEWKLFKRYSRYQALCFFGGVFLMILQFVLQGMFHLFIKEPKQP